MFSYDIYVSQLVYKLVARTSDQEKEILERKEAAVSFLLSEQNRQFKCLDHAFLFYCVLQPVSNKLFEIVHRSDFLFQREFLYGVLISLFDVINHEKRIYGIYT